MSNTNNTNNTINIKSEKIFAPIDYIKIASLIFLPLIIGLSIGFLFRPNEWYLKINKPWFVPPPIVFQIMWPILYILIGISLYYGIYDKEYIYWIIPIFHLFCNFLFSPIMFGMNNLLGGFLITFLTLITAIMMSIQFFITDKTFISIYVLIPYLIWLIFATILAYSTYKLN